MMRVTLAQRTSDSDSCTEDDDFSTLEEDSDPCIVDRQSGG
jgi:hypothetical protein